MAHISKFQVQHNHKGKKFGDYYRIQICRRVMGKPKTFHAKYLGKIKINLDKIRNNQNLESYKKIPIEELVDENGKHIIEPKEIEKILQKEVAKFGILDRRHERWIRKWAEIPKNKEITLKDLEKIIQKRIDPHDKTTKYILELTSEEGEKYIEFQEELRKEELIAQKKGEKIILNSATVDAGKGILAYRNNLNLIDPYTSDIYSEEKHDYLKDYNAIKNKIQPNTFDDPEDYMQWQYLQHKLETKSITVDKLTQYEKNLIEQAYRKFNDKKLKSVTVHNLIENPKMKKLREKISEFETKHTEALSHLKKFYENNKIDKIKISMDINWQHKHFMQDTQVVYSDVKESQALRLLKTASKKDILAKEKVKSLFINPNVKYNSLDEIKNVYLSHFAFRAGSELINSNGKDIIKITAYEKGNIRNFLNKGVKSGYFLKQLKKSKKGNKSIYVADFIGAASKGSLDFLAASHINHEGIRKNTSNEKTLLQKYSISKKALRRLITTKNLDFCESLHKGNQMSKELNKKPLTAKQMYNKLIKESVQISNNRKEGKKDNRQTLYDRGIRNLAEFSCMLSLVSKGNGTMLQGVRNILEVFDIAKIFNK